MTLTEIEIQLKSLSESKREITLSIEDRSNGIYIIHAKGIIDTYNSTEVGKNIEKALELEDIKHLVIDFSGISYMSSTGIGLFTSLLKTCKNKDVHLSLLNIQPKIKEVIDLLGFSVFFNIISNIDDIKTLTPSLFPLVTKCPHCSVSVKLPRTGRFQCKSCKGIITVNEESQVS